MPRLAAKDIPRLQEPQRQLWIEVAPFGQVGPSQAASEVA